MSCIETTLHEAGGKVEKVYIIYIYIFSKLLIPAFVLQLLTNNFQYFTN